MIVRVFFTRKWWHNFYQITAFFYRTSCLRIMKRVASVPTFFLLLNLVIYNSCPKLGLYPPTFLFGFILNQQKEFELLSIVSKRQNSGFVNTMRLTIVWGHIWAWRVWSEERARSMVHIWGAKYLCVCVFAQNLLTRFETLKVKTK